MQTSSSSSTRRSFRPLLTVEATRRRGEWKRRQPDCAYFSHLVDAVIEIGGRAMAFHAGNVVGMLSNGDPNSNEQSWGNLGL